MPPVRLERDGDVAEIVLAAPPLNLFDDALFAALVEAVAAVEADLPRALIVRAEGKVFTGGVDDRVLDWGTCWRRRAASPPDSPRARPGRTPPARRWSRRSQTTEWPAPTRGSLI
jgi:enoyl-CoA hydratase/carnithine racemase